MSIDDRLSSSLLYLSVTREFEDIANNLGRSCEITHTCHLGTARASAFPDIVRRRETPCGSKDPWSWLRKWYESSAVKLKKCLEKWSDYDNTTVAYHADIKWR